MSTAWLAKALTVLAEAYGHSLTAEQIEIYYRVLAKYSEAELGRAFRWALERNKFFPKPAELACAVQESATDEVTPNTFNANEYRDLQQRKAQGEKFYGMADLAEAVKQMAEKKKLA